MEQSLLSPLVSGIYKIKEKTAPAGYQLNTDEYTLVVSPTSNAIQTVKDEPIRTSVKATKQWVGPIGSAVTVHLYADDVDTGKTVTLNAANNWEDTFTNLRKYKPGTTTEIKYTVKEDAVANYDGVVSGDMATGFTITKYKYRKDICRCYKDMVRNTSSFCNDQVIRRWNREGNSYINCNRQLDTYIH